MVELSSADETTPSSLPVEVLPLGEVHLSQGQSQRIWVFQTHSHNQNYSHINWTGGHQGWGVRVVSTNITMGPPCCHIFQVVIPIFQKGSNIFFVGTPFVPPFKISLSSRQSQRTPPPPASLLTPLTSSLLTISLSCVGNPFVPPFKISLSSSQSQRTPPPPASLLTPLRWCITTA